MISEPSARDASIITVKQKQIPRNEKWIGIATGSLEIKQTLSANRYFVKASELFDIFRGTIEFVSRTSGGVGADAFFYLDDQTVRHWGLQKQCHKLLTSPRYAKFYSFGLSDWKKLKAKGSKCYLFLCSFPKNKLSKSILEYVRWGETECRNRSGVVCSKAKACQAREKNRSYRGWYDLGGVRKATIFTGRYSQYSRRFMLMETKLALDDGLIAFRPKVSLSKEQTKAILACLNSSFGQFFVEIYGQTTGGGMVSIDKIHGGDILIPDVRKVSSGKIARLAHTYEKLDEAARSIGGADRYENIDKLMPIIRTINKEVVQTFNLPIGLADRIEKISNFLMQRRISRARRAKPETLIGEEAPRIQPPRALRTERKPTTLDRWVRNAHA